MADPRNYVRPGQRLEIAAAQINYLNRLMRVDTSIGGGPLEGWERAANIVLARNYSGVPIPLLGVLALDRFTISINPTGGTIGGTDAASSRARKFIEKPVLWGGMPNATNVNFIGIAVEPVAVNAIGRFAVSGTVPCKVKLLTDTHRYARARVNDVTQLVSAGCGPVKLLWREYSNGEDKWAVGVL